MVDTNQTIILIYTTEQIEEENEPIPMKGAAMMYCFSQLKFMCSLKINKQHGIISLTCQNLSSQGSYHIAMTEVRVINFPWHIATSCFGNDLNKQATVMKRWSLIYVVIHTTSQRNNSLCMENRSTSYWQVPYFLFFSHTYIPDAQIVLSLL